MTGKKLISVSWWTFVYLLLAGALFAFSAMGDCLQGADGAACRSHREAFSSALLVGELLAYILLTWLVFFRRQ
ncbi:hypothetical protein M2341_000466 [Sphingobium sp. B7D2B]|uniref:hypothetical protein n=1 Tax=Sphingobium sp. B7D2B TaxID=2940583 RepID=UPI002224FCDC|nr:hypothetical protein [Sphingobium sp. B7D2B]MCW2365019.1 hypothetical protein [Sphingobium sp. B7D2B]